MIPTFPHPDDPQEDICWSKLGPEGEKEDCSTSSSRSSNGSEPEKGKLGSIEGSSASVAAAAAGATAGTAGGCSAATSNSKSSRRSSRRRPSSQQAEYPEQCKWVCQGKSQKEEAQDLAELLHNFPLIASKTSDARRLRQRRCSVCVSLMKQLAKEPPTTFAARTSRLNFGTKSGSDGAPGTDGLMEWPGATILSQVVCEAELRLDRQVGCKKLRLLQPLDAFVGMGDGALLLQLSHVPPAAKAKQALIVSIEAEDGPSTVAISAAPAHFGGGSPIVNGKCVQAMLLPLVRLSHQPLCPVAGYPGSAGGMRVGLQSIEGLRSGVASSRKQESVVGSQGGGSRNGEGEGRDRQAALAEGGEEAKKCAAASKAAGGAPVDPQAAAAEGGDVGPGMEAAVGGGATEGAEAAGLALQAGPLRQLLGRVRSGAATKEALLAELELHRLDYTPSLAACDAAAARELMSILWHKTGRSLERRRQLQQRLRQARQQQQQQAKQQEQQLAGTRTQGEKGSVVKQEVGLRQQDVVEKGSGKHRMDGVPAWKAWSFERLRRKQQNREQQEVDQQQQQQQAPNGSPWQQLAKELLHEVSWPAVQLPAACLGLDANCYSSRTLPLLTKGSSSGAADAEQRAGWGTWLPAAAVHDPEHACYGAGALPAGPLVPAEPLDGCERPRNAAMLRGVVAIVRRGSCSFVQKVQNMQAAGAIAAVVGNNQGQQELMGMVGDGNEDHFLTIPAVMVTKEDADALLWWVGRRPVVATIVQKPDEEAGELPLGLFGGLMEGPGPWMAGVVPLGMGLQLKQQPQQEGLQKGVSGKSLAAGQQRRNQQQQKEERVQAQVPGRKSVVLGQGAKWGKQRAAAARTLEELEGQAVVQEGSSSSSGMGGAAEGDGTRSRRSSSTSALAGAKVLPHVSSNIHNEVHGLEHQEQQQQQWEGDPEQEDTINRELAPAPDLWHAVQQELLGRLKQQNAQSGAGARKPGHEMIAGVKVTELQVDLFVPAQSQAWLQEHVLKKGVAAAQVHQTLVTDPQVLQMLTRGAQGKGKVRHSVGQSARHLRNKGKGKDGGH